MTTATASSRRSAAWHPLQQPGSSNTGASAGQVTAADQPAEWNIWEHRLPQSTLLAALPLGATAAATAGAEEAAPPVLLLEGVDLLARSTQQAEHGSPGLQLYVGESQLVGWPTLAGCSCLQTSMGYLLLAQSSSCPVNDCVPACCRRAVHRGCITEWGMRAGGTHQCAAAAVQQPGSGRCAS